MQPSSNLPKIFRSCPICSGPVACLARGNMSCTPNIVVYQVGAEVIDILRVLHSRQQYP
jgi:plasmid stabilization system protein ParE